MNSNIKQINFSLFKSSIYLVLLFIKYTYNFIIIVYKSLNLIKYLWTNLQPSITFKQTKLIADNIHIKIHLLRFQKQPYISTTQENLLSVLTTIYINHLGKSPVSAHNHIYQPLRKITCQWSQQFINHSEKPVSAHNNLSTTQENLLSVLII